MNKETVNPDNHPLEYLLPGNLIARVDHPTGLDVGELARLINGHLRNPESQNGLGLANDVLPVKPGNILAFPRTEDQMQTFSIVPVELKRAHRQKVIEILLQVNKIHQAKPVELAPDVIWRSESPNWLLGSGGHGAPHPPSPGSWPLARKARKAEDWQFSLVDKDTGEKGPLPFADGANVHVAILDTAPLDTDLDEAYETWHGQNELIDRLFKPQPNRELRLVTDFYAEIDLADCSLARHRYKMKDHGPFIAGEIASIAPGATLHLYKVFTAYGSASTLTLAQGLLRVLTDLRDGELKTPLVVNFSGGLAVPDHYDPKFHPDFPVEFRDPETLKQMQTSLEALFTELTDQNQVIVVAAAGNDSDTTNGRAPARLPAAYPSVIGVGALPKGFPRSENGQYIAASYSNFADNPKETGYMTLGGEPGRGNGILGIYTSETPYYLQKQGENHHEGELPPDPQQPELGRLRYNIITNNQEGSADWAGTSQATPIITGLLARWCSEQISKGGPITVADARTALDSLSQGQITDAGERVIPVTQG